MRSFVPEVRIPAILAYILIVGNFTILRSMEPIALTDNRQNELFEELQKGSCSREQLRMFLERGADIHAKDELGRTLLHYAVYCKKLMMILRDAGAKVNAQDCQVMTPLHRLMSMRVRGERAWGSSLEEIAFLLDNGADVTIRDNDGRSPLFYFTIHYPKHLAYKAQSDSVLKINKQLLEHVFQQVRRTDSEEVQAELYYWVGTLLYVGGLGFRSANVDNALNRLVRAAGQSYSLAAQASANYVLGKIYLERAGRMPCLAKALECFEKVANQPHNLIAQAWANYRLGKIYLDGFGPILLMLEDDLCWGQLKKDSGTAYKYLKKASEQSYDVETQASATYYIT